ncbi:hypothetical protein SO802_002716 [Lithocarpus litseifolius]|uniref:DUF4283 domain-containing protein n=1 Tax=Lithocarpus litseifolius TaxID=425828 RepID=A0AAW2E0M4_9ROSI
MVHGTSPAMPMAENNITFTHSPFWVQLWGLPFKLMSEEIGHDIRGKVIEVDKRSMQTDQARPGQVHEINLSEKEGMWQTEKVRGDGLLFGTKGFPFFAVTVESLGMTKNTAHQVLQNNALIDNMASG